MYYFCTCVMCTTWLCDLRSSAPDQKSSLKDASVFQPGEAMLDTKSLCKVVTLLLRRLGFCANELCTLERGRTSSHAATRFTAVVYSTHLFPFVFVVDEAFALHNNLLKPYSQKLLNESRNTFNKRLSRARVNVENTLGILNSRFGVFQKPINLRPSKATVVTFAYCYFIICITFWQKIINIPSVLIEPF